MSNEFIYKVIRIFIALLTFMCLVNINGMNTREAHQFIFVLGSYILFALLLRNIWLTLFVWWSVLIYSFFKFNCGSAYITNIISGCIIYYLTKIAFEKKHIDFFINIALWVLFANLAYGIVQMFGYDFIYSHAEVIQGIIPAPIGFMGNTGITALFIALCIPLVATRKSLHSTILAGLLFIPIFILHSTTSVIAGTIAFLFCMYHKYTRKAFYIITASMLLLASLFFVVKVATSINTNTSWAGKAWGSERFNEWQLVLKDCNVHPVSGWGLDSFRNFNSIKQHKYGSIVSKDNYNIWDNPHNLYISLFFEFGLIGLILLGGYLRQCVIWFNKSDRNRNVVALAGFIICFMVLSIGQFPAFLARIMVVAIPLFGMYEVSVKN